MINKTILVVDDEKNIRMLFEDELTEAGFQVITAENGKEGLRLAQQAKPDLILLDIKMPDMHGVEVLKRLRETDITTPVIMVTAHGARSPLSRSMTEWAIRSKELNIADYITKPVDLEELIGKIKSILHLS
ncbi:MAG: response regulator [bacterium]|nr:response regulator [bacterium]